MLIGSSLKSFLGMVHIVLDDLASYRVSISLIKITIYVPAVKGTVNLQIHIFAAAAYIMRKVNILELGIFQLPMCFIIFSCQAKRTTNHIAERQNLKMAVW